ncbi:MAG: hypothetical protein ACO363_06950, partial [Balneolaceae bacterium]
LSTTLFEDKPIIIPMMGDKNKERKNTDFDPISLSEKKDDTIIQTTTYNPNRKRYSMVSVIYR